MKKVIINMNVYCFLDKIKTNQYGICIIYYNNNIRVESFMTVYGENIKIVEMDSIIKVIDFCYINKFQNCIIITNIKSCIRKIKNFKEYLGDIRNIIKTNNIKFKNHNKLDYNYNLSSKLIKKIPKIYKEIDNNFLYS